MPYKPTDNIQRVNLFLDPKIVEKAKIQSVKERQSLSRIVEKALNFYMLPKNLKEVLEGNEKTNG